MAFSTTKGNDWLSISMYQNIYSCDWIFSTSNHFFFKSILMYIYSGFFFGIYICQFSQPINLSHLKYFDASVLQNVSKPQCYVIFRWIPFYFYCHGQLWVIDLLLYMSTDWTCWAAYLNSELLSSLLDLFVCLFPIVN